MAAMISRLDQWAGLLDCSVLFRNSGSKIRHEDAQYIIEAKAGNMLADWITIVSGIPLYPPHLLDVF